MDTGILWEILSDKNRKASLQGAFEEMALDHDRLAIQAAKGRKVEDAYCEATVADILRGVVSKLEKLAKK